MTINNSFLFWVISNECENNINMKQLEKLGLWQIIKVCYIRWNDLSQITLMYEGYE